MSETTTCPTCGTPVRVVSKPYIGTGPDLSVRMVNAYTSHYEPLGLDSLERAVVELAVREHAAFRAMVIDANSERAWRRLRDEYRTAASAVIAARAANVGKEAGEVT